MLLEALRFLLALLLIYFLPGFMLLKALFPRKYEIDKEYPLFYQCIIGIGLSIVIFIFVGLFLGALPPNSDGKGYFTTPYIELSLLGLTFAFFLVGWYRNAFGILNERFPYPLKRKEKKEDIGEKCLVLVKEEERIKADMRKYEKLAKGSEGDMREVYEKKVNECKKKIEEIEKKLRKLEEKRGDELSK